MAALEWCKKKVTKQAKLASASRSSRRRERDRPGVESPIVHDCRSRVMKGHNETMEAKREFQFPADPRPILAPEEMWAGHKATASHAHIKMHDDRGQQGELAVAAHPHVRR
ncbi:unnamed protein product [Boreogadus saida]